MKPGNQSLQNDWCQEVRLFKSDAWLNLLQVSLARLHKTVVPKQFFEGC
jgi:hypothetical protein